jgi:hypothetical protein
MTPQAQVVTRYANSFDKGINEVIQIRISWLVPESCSPIIKYQVQIREGYLNEIIFGMIPASMISTSYLTHNLL